MTSEMFDSIDASQIPPGQDDAGYVDGRWRTFTALHGPHNLSVAVFPADDADAGDDEPGDMTNQQAAAWAKRELGLGHWRPCIYTSVSNVPALLAALAAVGIARDQVRIWTAHYTYKSHRCSHACNAALPADFLADGTQWTDRSGGRNLDESTIADDFFGPALPILPFSPEKDDDDMSYLVSALNDPANPAAGGQVFEIINQGTQKRYVPDTVTLNSLSSKLGAPVPVSKAWADQIPTVANGPVD